MKKNIIILSMPRSGSSLLAQLVQSVGYSIKINNNSTFLKSSEFNRNGYQEEIAFTLLNDQLVRMLYGNKYSFLFAPTYKQFNTKFRKNSIKIDKNFEYDINENTLFMPSDYENRIFEYISSGWDVWGLTRMKQHQKWYKCYAQYGIDTKKKILKKVQEYQNSINNSSNIIVKDPRLALVFPFFNFKNIKILIIKRNKNDVLNSMRNHYGKNIFTNKTIDDTKYVSNHFNYKIRSQNFNDYYDNYEQILDACADTHESLTIDYNKLICKKETKRLNDFLGSSADFSIID